MFESIIGEADSKFNLGKEKAGDLLAAILGLIERDGFAGFFARFENAGLGDLANSWISRDANTPISNEQLASALGENTLKNFADEAGTDYKTATSAAAFVVPHVIDELTPSGTMPHDADLTAMLGGGLPEMPATTAAANIAGEPFDRMDASVSSAAIDDFDGDDPANENPVLKWLLPLIILAIMVVLGYWFCGKSTPVVTNINTNTNTNTAKTNANADTTKTTANAVDSSFKIDAKDGKYTVSGVVPDQATFDKIKTALTAQFGEGNVDFSGLKVDANAQPFAANWWTNFEKMLPNLKSWQNGVLAFTGNAITEASGLPTAALDQLKSLFSGWTMPVSMNGSTAADGDRKLTEVALPDGTKLQAYPNGIEDQLIKFIESDEYKNANADTLKDKWFSFDDLNFKFGTTELVPESKRQLDNIVAILKAFPDVKIKIGGYTDKKGDDTANKKLSDERAKAVKAALDKAGVGAQVPEAEGYGEEFATVPETAGDEEREVDRKTSVRLIK